MDDADSAPRLPPSLDRVGDGFASRRTQGAHEATRTVLGVAFVGDEREVGLAALYVAVETGDEGHRALSEEKPVPKTLGAPPVAGDRSDPADGRRLAPCTGTTERLGRRRLDHVNALSCHKLSTGWPASVIHSLPTDYGSS